MIRKHIKTIFLSLFFIVTFSQPLALHAEAADGVMNESVKTKLIKAGVSAFGGVITHKVANNVEKSSASKGAFLFAPLFLVPRVVELGFWGYSIYKIVQACK